MKIKSLINDSLQVELVSGDLDFRQDTLSQTYISSKMNERVASAHTKTRGDVSGGGRKPWRQKGTGRARHGSTRSPIWRKGGVAFGPRKEVNHSRKITKKMAKIAFISALQYKYADEKIFVEELSTINRKDIQEKYSTKYSSILIITDNIDNAKKYRNLKNVFVKQARTVAVADLMDRMVLIIDKDSTKLLEERLNDKNA